MEDGLVVVRLAVIGRLAQIHLTELVKRAAVDVLPDDVDVLVAVPPLLKIEFFKIYKYVRTFVR